MIAVGSAPISWGACEIADWGDLLAPERVLDEMAAAGYAGTELGPPGFLPADSRALRSALAARGLAPIGAFHPVALHDATREAEAIEAALATARRLVAVGATVLVLAAEGDARRETLAGRVPLDGGASLDQRAWAYACTLVDRIAAEAAALGLRTAFHPHAASYVETPDEIERLLAGTDPALVGLCLDTGHVGYGGGDPAALAREYAARVRHVHLKDLRREVHASAVARGIAFRDAVGEGVFAPLGDGDLDLRGTLSTLREAGFDGWIVVEQDTRLGITPGTAPLDDARRSRAFVREAIGA